MRAWKKLIPEVKIVIVLIAESIPENLSKYSEYIKLFLPIKNVSTSFISQYIRILYPCILNSNEGILITDMDILPLNSRYYINSIQNIPNNKFVYYRGLILGGNEYSICLQYSK